MRIILILTLAVVTVQAQNPEEFLNEINLPEGFKIEVFASNIENARSLEKGPDGVVFLGNRGGGKVYALVDKDLDGKADNTYVLAEGLNQPNGVAFRNGDLYIGEISRISVMRDIVNHLVDPPKMETIRDDFPTESHHGAKHIAFGPDGKLYVPVGAPCNICLEEDERFASIMRMNADGTELELFASGIRNTVGLAWHPQTKELWFTDNGRDWLGDNKPNDELNHAPRQGMHFGYPFCHNGDLPDPKFGDQRDCAEFEPPVQKLLPHIAPLGLTFLEKDAFPESYRSSVFIAEHGSWNRTTPIGYRVSRVELIDGKAVTYEAFADGWLQGSKRLGRPVDVLELNDGSLLVSDDHANCVYRITYTK
ncbi:MAG: sorbosone dehydrogenase family protein [Flavobacteriales bacterium]|nr:sorbosone dehydrogenase family protein [Flavobacteriales bacterium]MCB9191983.1 sorbosone dehydrogenase family protein [Flavobacteriales bacterium]MCB9205003.1 sorbosone dehydrogenase family protein [Flavobacteriales bacterium]